MQNLLGKWGGNNLEKYKDASLLNFSKEISAKKIENGAQSS